MKVNYRRALMIVMVFLVSMLSPLGLEPEPVEAHYDPPPTDPPLRIQVFVKKLYADQDYDDGHLLGGEADILMWSKVKHESHGETFQSQEIEWNMDDGFFSPTQTSVEIYGIEPGGEEWVREVFEYDMESLEIYDHIECTPRTHVYYSYITSEDDNWGYQFWLDLTAGILGISSGASMTIQGGVTVGVGVFGTAVLPPGGAAVTAVGGLMMGVGGGLTYAGWQTLSKTWGPDEEYHDVIGQNHHYKLEPGVNYIWPEDRNGASTSGIGVEVELRVTAIPPVDLEWWDGYGASCTSTRLQGLPSVYPPEGNEEEYDETYQFEQSRQDVRDGFNSLRNTYPVVNESTSFEEGFWEGYNDKYGNSTPLYPNGSEASNMLRENPQYNSTTHTIWRGMILNYFNELVENITKEFLTLATAANPDDVYEPNMDLWYANFLTQDGKFFDALAYYESAIIGSIDAIENAPPPPPSTVTIQAGGDDIPEDLFIEIYSGDCGDDCSEEDLVFVGEEGDSEIETTLESGEYTVVMIADGDVYSSDYLEVQSGGDITVLMTDGGIEKTALNLAFYIQGLIVAALPALIGFAGSRQYLEREDESSESKLEPSTTPLWIGVVTFLAIFFMMIG